MFLQAAGLWKTLSTLPAVVVTSPFRAVMSEFLQRCWKTVPAFDAKICRIFAFPQPVSSKQSGCSESPPALRAVVGLQPAVDSLMFNEDRVMLEALVTLGAFMDS